MAFMSSFPDGSNGSRGQDLLEVGNSTAVPWKIEEVCCSKSGGGEGNWMAHYELVFLEGV